MLVNRHNDPNRGASQDGDPKTSAPQSLKPPLPPEVEAALNEGMVAEVPAQEVDQTQPIQKKVTKAESKAEDPQVELKELVRLLSISIQKQTEIAERAGRKDLEEEIKQATKREQYAKNRGDDTQAVIAKQTRCQHLKGGRYRKGDVDFAVYYHRFIDATCYIKCMLCKMKWYPTDTPDVIFRGGEARKNHTGIGWIEASKMCFQQSTNQWSSSELAGTPKPYTEENKHTIPDTLGVITGPS